MKLDKKSREKIEELFRKNPGKPFRVTDVSQAIYKSDDKRSTVHYHLKALKKVNFLSQNTEGEYIYLPKQNVEDELVKRVYEKKEVDQDTIRALIQEVLGNEIDLNKELKRFVATGILHVTKGDLSEDKFMISLGPFGSNLQNLCPICGESLTREGDAIVYFDTMLFYQEEGYDFNQDCLVFAHASCAITTDIQGRQPQYFAPPLSFHICAYCHFPLSPKRFLELNIDEEELALYKIIPRFFDAFELYTLFNCAMQDKKFMWNIRIVPVTYSGVQQMMLNLRQYANDTLKKEYCKDDSRLYTRIDELFKQCSDFERDLRRSTDDRRFRLIQEFYGPISNNYSHDSRKNLLTDDVFWPASKGYDLSIVSTTFVKIIREGNQNFHPGCYNRFKKVEEKIQEVIPRQDSLLPAP
nr:hypothetical protein [Candidatus Sigynarchaeota archaeon]